MEKPHSRDFVIRANKKLVRFSKSDDKVLNVTLKTCCIVLSFQHFSLIADVSLEVLYEWNLNVVIRQMSFGLCFICRANTLFSSRDPESYRSNFTIWWDRHVNSLFLTQLTFIYLFIYLSLLHKKLYVSLK